MSAHVLFIGYRHVHAHWVLYDVQFALEKRGTSIFGGMETEQKIGFTWVI